MKPFRSKTHYKFQICIVDVRIEVRNQKKLKTQKNRKKNWKLGIDVLPLKLVDQLRLCHSNVDVHTSKGWRKARIGYGHQRLEW